MIMLAGCASTDVKNYSEEPSSDESVKNEVPLSKKVYYVQHRLIPNWLFSSEGAFFSDMQNGVTSELITATRDIVSQEFANQIVISAIVGQQAVLITFPEPESPPNCFYAIIEKTETGFKYTTYESTIDVTNSGIAGVVGGWDIEGGHQNYGPRGYKKASDFVNDVFGIN